ncbi:MAG: UPF0158 family protein [Chloroflexota bacterium]
MVVKIGNLFPKCVRGRHKNAQQSVHPTLGILRKSQAVSHALSFFQLDGFAVPAPARVTPTVGQPVFDKGYNLLMTLVVSLRDFVGEMQTLSDDRHVYLNKVSGEFIMLFDDDLLMAESDIADELLDWPAEPVQDVKKVLSSDEYLKLPSAFDIHEYEIMERFCLSVADEKISNVLLSKIHGSGAFRRFRDTIYQYGIEEDWFKYRDEAYKEIAISWLENHGFDYIDDMNKHEKSI